MRADLHEIGRSHCRRLLAGVVTIALLGACGRDPAAEAGAAIPADAEGHAHADHHRPEAEHGHGEAGGHGDEETGGRGHEGEGADALRLSAEQMQAAGITVVAAAPGSIDSGVALLGEVQPNGDRLAHIAPRFPGIVREVRKNAGDRVRAGDVLAVIESSESLSRYELKTLIEGVVLSKHVTLGESVDRDKQTFVIADLSSVWVELSVYQKDLAGIGVGQVVRISVNNEQLGAEGTISYVTPSVDPLTRTATARVVLPNEQGAWRPGMFVRARVSSATAASVSIPQIAVQRVEGETAVFVETPEGFEVRPIRIGREGGQLVEVLSGLAAGERVVAQNAFLLKAELGKSEAEHEH